MDSSTFREMLSHLEPNEKFYTAFKSVDLSVIQKIITV